MTGAIAAGRPRAGAWRLRHGRTNGSHRARRRAWCSPVGASVARGVSSTAKVPLDNDCLSSDNPGALSSASRGMGQIAALVEEVAGRVSGAGARQGWGVEELNYRL